METFTAYDGYDKVASNASIASYAIWKQLYNEYGVNDGIYIKLREKPFDNIKLVTYGYLGFYMVAMHRHQVCKAMHSIEVISLGNMLKKYHIDSVSRMMSGGALWSQKLFNALYNNLMKRLPDFSELDAKGADSSIIAKTNECIQTMLNGLKLETIVKVTVGESK